MPFTKFTNLDFDQIKTQIKDYLRANSSFTDFDFDFTLHLSDVEAGDVDNRSYANFSVADLVGDEQDVIGGSCSFILYKQDADTDDRVIYGLRIYDSGLLDTNSPNFFHNSKNYIDNYKYNIYDKAD